VHGWDVATSVGTIVCAVGVILGGIRFFANGVKKHIDDRDKVIADTAELGVRTAMAAHRRMDEKGWPPPDYAALLTNGRRRS
jgi:hypothetical protein